MAFPAGTKIFTGAGQSGNWADPMNWQGDAAAKSNSIVVVPTNAILNGAFTTRQLMFLGQEQVTINGALTTLGTGLCTSFMVCDYAVATFTSSSSLQDHGGLLVGNDSVGTLIAESKASAHSTLVTVSGKLGKAVDGTGTITIDGAHWQNSQNIQVGVAGHGTLNVTNGGLITVGTDVIAGDMAGSVGHISLSSGGTMQIAGHVKIGGSTTTALGGTGTLSVGAGSLFSAAGVLKITTTGAVTMAGGTIATTANQEAQIWPKASVTGYGTFTSPTGIDNTGTITATGGTLTLNGNITGQGTLDIAANSTAVLNAATIGKMGIAFTGSNASLVLSHGVGSMASISGFDATDHITMAGVDALSWNGTTDVLTLSQGGAVVDNLQFTGTYAADPFALTQTIHGAMITLGAHP